MKPDNLNPAEKTVAEADYDSKFNKSLAAKSQNIKDQEASPDEQWKTSVDTKSDVTEKQGKGKNRLRAKRGGKLRKGSAFAFIIALLTFGVWYTSVFAPNILLVNVKEMYTNDLADATTALEIYTQIVYFNKIGPTSGQDCTGGPAGQQSITCKLTTMSRSQKEAFEQQGFSFGVPIPASVKKLIPGGSQVGDFCAQKVSEDNRDDGDPRNDQPESRYKVYCILPPSYTDNVKKVLSGGGRAISDIASGSTDNVDDDIKSSTNQLLAPLQSALSDPKAMLETMLTNQVIVSGPQLWLYAQLSTSTKEQVYSVFNPRSSFFHDALFKQRLKTRYNMTNNVTVSGTTEKQVNQSFDSSVQKSDDGLGLLTGQINPSNGISLASLSGPLNLTQLQSIASGISGGVSLDTVKSLTNKLPAVADLEVAGNLLATKTFSYTDLMCSWYTIGEMSNNALVRAKASTAARYALQYLKAADAIKAGTSEEVPTNVLASKLAENTFGGYNGGSVTDSLSYRMITFGDAFPSSVGGALSSLMDATYILAYNLSAPIEVASLMVAWTAAVIPNAAALGAITGAPGVLTPPPTNVALPGIPALDRQYCISGETTENQTAIKGQSTQDTKCPAAITAMAPVGMQAAVADAIEVGRRTCPPVNASDDNLIQLYLGTWRGPVSNTILPSQKIVGLTMTPYVAALFGVNTMLSATVSQQLYTSQIKGQAANYALFSGMGELLGDMAMSRGLMPSDAADMELYLHVSDILGGKKAQEDIARAEAKKHPFDPYNKFSFVGSLTRSFSPTVNEKAPVFATLSNVFSLVSSGAQKAVQPSSANAFYRSQPSLLTTDAADTAAREAIYAARLSSVFCPNPQYEAILIQADFMCNVRYSMPFDDIPIALNVSGVVDYLSQSHPDAYQSKIDELTERVAKADVQGSKEYLQKQLNDVLAVQNKPFIDKATGKPTPGSEYDKYLQYCVNRLDPWGSSAVGQLYKGLSAEEQTKRLSVRDNGDAVSPEYDLGDPFEITASGEATMAVTAAQSDQDWYSGKNCTRAVLFGTGGQSLYQMVQYFRVFYTLCSVDGSMSGIIDCSYPDYGAGYYSDPFYLNNDILFTSQQ